MPQSTGHMGEYQGSSGGRGLNEKTWLRVLITVFAQRIQWGRVGEFEQCRTG